MDMKHNIALTTLMIAFVALFFLNTAATAQAKLPLHSCSNATLAGKWGFTSTGFLIGIGPVAATAISTFDGKGNLSGSQTRSVNGDVADETFAGTYTVNSDCTATDIVKVYQSGQLVRTTTLQIVIDQNGEHGHAIFSKVELPDYTILPAVITLDATRLFPKDQD
jgi:hypothetical protein